MFQVLLHWKKIKGKSECSGSKEQGGKEGLEKAIRCTSFTMFQISSVVPVRILK